MSDFAESIRADALQSLLIVSDLRAQLADRDSKLAALEAEKALIADYGYVLNVAATWKEAQHKLDVANSKLAALVEALQIVGSAIVCRTDLPDFQAIVGPIFADTAAFARERDERLQRDAEQKALREAADDQEAMSRLLKEGISQWGVRDDLNIKVADWLRARADALTSTGDRSVDPLAPEVS